FRRKVAEYFLLDKEKSMRSRTLLACLILITLTAVTTALSATQTTLSPQQILARMSDVYANCTSYRDEGKVVSSFEEISFATVFERPARFRFEYIRSGP